MSKWRLFIIAIFSLVLFVSVFLVMIYHEVATDASTRIKRGVIKQTIFSESPVFYDDVNSIIGVFFEKTHRKFISYKEIPSMFIKAIVASEDKSFFTHPGFDIKAIFRAFATNIKAGRVVQGGSTITQQTAKNIFKREKRSYKSKFKELIQALLLEKKYTKEEILEMYTNQFFVTGFGSGLRIAAQYFFDKEAEALNLLESAFIAGSVKGPFRYNPFTKKTEAEKSEAVSLAKARKDYVLLNMLRMNFITKSQYADAIKKPVPFKEGKITYKLNVILDYIREQLESDFFRKILYEEGIDNIATSGIRIYTSINKEIQEGAFLSLRKHLPLFDVMLSGYDRENLQERYRNLAGKSLKKPKNDLLFLCRVTYVNHAKDNPYLMVAWDGGGGIVDYEGIKQIGDAWIKGEKGPGAQFSKDNALSFLKLFKTGDLVPVALMDDVGGSEGTKKIVLSRFPELEGGIVVINEGMIKAMVGGFFNRFFNRAADAKRQLGSIFKPIVYTAAQGLKWNNLDPLHNFKDLFRFETTAYVPKPDHQPESDIVSMLWAGVKSENLATIWLLYHLTDKLNMGEFRQIAGILGLNRKKDETYEEYIKRIRDRHGVVVNREALMEAAFEESKKVIEADLIFNGLEDVLFNIQRLHYDVDLSGLNLGRNDSAYIKRMSFKRLLSLNFVMKRNLATIKGSLLKGKDNGYLYIPGDFKKELGNFYFKDYGKDGFRILYIEAPGQRKYNEFNPVNLKWLLEKIENINEGDIWIDGLIPSQSIKEVQEQIKIIYKRFIRQKRYGPGILYKIRDFKTLVNMHYATSLSEKMGISTALDPVLAFPLGANAISILDASLAYHTIMTGNYYPLSKDKSSWMAPIIKKIVDRQGEVLWEYSPKPETIISKRISESISEILRVVMEKGTGRKAGKSVRFKLNIENETHEITVPTYGKTGTSNRFTNSSFVGYIPGINRTSGQFDLDKGYAIASYVGYDDNRPMKGKHVTIYGSSGALPLWADTANAIVKSNGFTKELDASDLAFLIGAHPKTQNESFQPVRISPISGLPLTKEGLNESEIDGYPLVNIYSKISDDELILKRAFEPIPGVSNEK